MPSSKRQLYAPVSPDGSRLVDSCGDIVATCLNENIATAIAHAVNFSAGFTDPDPDSDSGDRPG